MRKTFTLALAAAGLGVTASAETVWAIEAYSDVCRVVLEEDANRIGEGNVTHLDQGCRVGPFARYMAGEAGTVLFLDSYGTIQMSVSPEGDGYGGIVGDGDPVSMSVMSIGPAKAAPAPAPVRPKPRTPAPRGMSSSATADDCIRYHDTRQCAQDHDLGIPGSTFDLLPIETRARMNKRFMASLNSSIEGQVGPRVCLDVRNCTENRLNEEVWCEVNHDGDWSWILKQDADFVYAGTGCG